MRTFSDLQSMAIGGLCVVAGFIGIDLSSPAEINATLTCYDGGHAVALVDVQEARRAGDRFEFRTVNDEGEEVRGSYPVASCYLEVSR